MDIEGTSSSAARLHGRLKRLGKYGHIEGTERGVNSLALTDSNIMARIKVMMWMEELDLGIKIDEVGNIYGILPAVDGNISDNIVLTGSHIDTVPTGGIYDGRLLLSGLEVIRNIQARNEKTDYPIATAVFTAEEGARFQPAMIGSRVATGLMTAQEALGIQSHIEGDTMTLGEGLERFRQALKAAHDHGYLKGDYSQGWVSSVGNIRAYVEPHIEQGPELDDQGIPIAAVTDVLGISQRILTIDMAESNQDPGITILRILRQTREIANTMEEYQRSTVGMIDFPGTEPTERMRSFHIEGVSAHAGACPMRLRQDAGLASAEIADTFRKAIRTHAPELQAKIPFLQLEPNTINVVPERATITLGLDGASEAQWNAIMSDVEHKITQLQRVKTQGGEQVTITTLEAPVLNTEKTDDTVGIRMTVDFRNKTDPEIDTADAMLSDYLTTLAQNTGVAIHSQRKQRLAPLSFHGQLTDLETDTIVKVLGDEAPEKPPQLVLGAGHDAHDFAIARFYTAMFALRNQHGSHNVLEHGRGFRHTGGCYG